MGIFRNQDDKNGPDAKWSKPSDRSYLERPGYRTLSEQKVDSWSDEQLVDFMARSRWPGCPEGQQVCPECGTVDSHYRVAKTGGWKCRSPGCAKFFTILSGTCFHGVKLQPRYVLKMLFTFAEAKDSISAREISGHFDCTPQTTRILLMKVREAIRVSMEAEPKLFGYVQADAAYFAKYVRPGNIGTGAALARKAKQRTAGLNGTEDVTKPTGKEGGRAKPVISEKMHALVVFVQQGGTGQRRYKVGITKTESQVPLLDMAREYCENSVIAVTDQHAGYNLYAAQFEAHKRVNHNVEFMTDEGFHTNHAEAFFSRVRAAVAGAWHKVTVANLLEYAWEFAWRQSMTGIDNKSQVADLLHRVLSSGRAQRWGDYWGSKRRKERREASSRSESATGEVAASRDEEDQDASYRLMEVDKTTLKKKRGRPPKDSLRNKAPPAPAKRPYRKRNSAMQPIPTLLVAEKEGTSISP